MDHRNTTRNGKVQSEIIVQAGKAVVRCTAVEKSRLAVRLTCGSAVRIVAVAAVLLLGVLGCNSHAQKPPVTAKTHPVFKTPVSAAEAPRPAIQVEILDDREFFSTAELFLRVQSSRSPEDVGVLFPVNVGDFQGCRSRFIQLPFEVHAGDTLLFNLLDEDELSAEEEKPLLSACKATGYCLLVAGMVYRPDLARLVVPLSYSVEGVLGTVVMQFRASAFENVGTAEFIVPESLPNQPHKANRLTVIEIPNRARLNVKVYQPRVALK